MTGGSATYNLTLGGTAELTPAYAPTPIKRTLAATPNASLSFGVDTSKFNLAVQQVRPLVAGANEVLNLYDGSLYTLTNESAAFRLVRWIIFRVVSGGDISGVTIGANGSADFACGMGGTTPTQTIYPSSLGGIPFQAASPAGLTVSNTLKNVKVVNNGAVLVNYEVVILGTNIADPPAGTPIGPFGPFIFPHN